MGLSVGATFLKWMLFFFNLIFLISGVLLLAVGIWIKVDIASFVDSVDKVGVHAEAIYLAKSILLSSSYNFHIASYVLIGIGAFILLVSFFGCCGACCQMRPLLVLYAILVILVLGVELAVGVAGGIMRDQVGIDARHGLQRMADRYGYVGTGVTLDGTSVIDQNTTRTLRNPMETNLWNSLQAWYGCCGIDSYEDFSRSPYWDNVKGRGIAPVFCCKFDDFARLKLENPACYNVASRNTVLVSNYHTGCYTKLTTYLANHVPAVIGVAIGCALFQLLAIVFALLLCRAIGRTDKYVTEYKRMDVINVN